PVYKLLALAIGLLVLVIVAVATSSAAPSVLAAAAAGTVVWLALGPFSSAGPKPSSSRHSVSRPAATAAASASNSASVIPARRRTVNNISQRGSPTPPGIT